MCQCCCVFEFEIGNCSRIIGDEDEIGGWGFEKKKEEKLNFKVQGADSAWCSRASFCQLDYILVMLFCYNFHIFCFFIK